MATTTLGLLQQVPVPVKTDSYNPVPHTVLVASVKEHLQAKNYKIVHESYQQNSDGMQMFGNMAIEVAGADQNMSIGFRNSYDKSLAVGLVAGSRIIVCSNLMFKGDIKLLRKHTTNVYKDIDAIINQAIEGMEPVFNEIVEESAKWKNRELSRKEMAEFAGRMFVEEDLLNTTQLSIVKKEIKFSEHFKNETVWDFVNHCTEAYKKSHVSSIMQQHLRLNNYVRDMIIG